MDNRVQDSPALSKFLASLAEGQRNAVVTTNWDIVIERLLGDRPFHYAIPMAWTRGEPFKGSGMPICKLHGSANWAYCDCCKRLFMFRPSTGKDALYRQIFIDKDDFRALHQLPEGPWPVSAERKAMCFDCEVRLSSRVATFSYAKTLDFVHFVATWENAFRALQAAKNWIFVGYSFPEADFELRYLLKMAERGRGKDPSPRITVILRHDEPATERYRRFFGKALATVCVSGFEEWFEQCGDDLH